MHVDGVGSVAFHKRRGTRSIRLKIDIHGKPIVTMPYFVPYRTAVYFVQKHTDWIDNEASKRNVQLPDGMQIGKTHTLQYVPQDGLTVPRSRISSGAITVRYDGNWEDEDVQNVAKKACIRALRQEAQVFLPKRLANLAQLEGYDYSGVSIKQMRGRWGSCNQDKHITLNLFLMQLPIELVDYVILHELAHTRALHHGPAFWTEMERTLPNARQLRKQMRAYEPSITAARVA